MQTVNWTAGNGSEIQITVESAFELYADGTRREDGRKTVEITATVDGKEVDHHWVQKTNHPVAVAKLGPIGMTQANYDRLMAAIEAVESEIADHNAAYDAHANALDAISDSGRKIQ